jgi:hypothetical protein
MKKILFIFAFIFLIAKLSFATPAVYQYSNQVTLPSGASANGATVYVYSSGTVSTVTLYDSTVTPISNPMTTNAQGVFSFYAPVGTYDIRIALTGYPTSWLRGVGISAAGTLNTAYYISQYASVNAAQAALTGNTSAVLVLDANKSLTGDVTLTVPVVAQGGVISYGAHTLTLALFSDPGSIKAFDPTGSGVVIFTSATQVIPAEAFGAVGDNATDNTAAIAALMKSATASQGHRVAFGFGTFLTGGYTTNLSMNPWSVVIEGQSTTGTYIKLKASGNNDLFGINVGQTNPLSWPSYWIFRNITLDGNNANNTSGTCLSFYQCNLFKLENVVLQNGAEWDLKIVKSIGVVQSGALPIWGNTVDATKGLGAVYVQDSTDIDLGNIALQSFHGTQVPLLIVGTAGTAEPITVAVKGFHIEDSTNAIKVVDNRSWWGASVGMSVDIGVSVIRGLASGGGSAIDVSGGPQTKVFVHGGNLLNDWTGGAIKTNVTGTAVTGPIVEVENLGFVTDTSAASPQYDYTGYIMRHGDFDRYNFIPNGAFTYWDSLFPTTVPALGFGSTYSAGTITTTNHSAPAAYYYDNTSGGFPVTVAEYIFTTQEVLRARGKYLQATLWVKGASANAADTYINVAAPSLPGGAQDYIANGLNHGTAWERVRAAGLVPTDATAITVYARIMANKDAIVDDWMASAGYVGGFIAKSEKILSSRLDMLPYSYAPNVTAVLPVTFTAPGAVFGDQVQVALPTTQGYEIIQGYVSAADTVSVVISNATATWLAPSGTWTVTVDHNNK